MTWILLRRRLKNVFPYFLRLAWQWMHVHISIDGGFWNDFSSTCRCTSDSAVRSRLRIDGGGGGLFRESGLRMRIFIGFRSTARSVRIRDISRHVTVSILTSRPVPVPPLPPSFPLPSHSLDPRLTHLPSLFLPLPTSPPTPHVTTHTTYHLPLITYHLSLITHHTTVHRTQLTTPHHTQTPSCYETWWRRRRWMDSAVHMRMEAGGRSWSECCCLFKQTRTCGRWGP